MSARWVPSATDHRWHLAGGEGTRVDGSIVHEAACGIAVAVPITGRTCTECERVARQRGLPLDG